MTEENEVAEQEPVAQEETEQQPQQAKEPDIDKNWREANRVLAMQKAEIEELRQAIAKQKPPEIDEFADLDPDDYITTSKAKAMAEKLAERKAQETAHRVVQEYVQKQQLAADEEKMRSKYDDYDYVIENFVIPEMKTNPVLAQKLMAAKNPAEMAYKIGKLSDGYEDQAVEKKTSPKAERILKNAARPVSSNAVSQPLKHQAEDYSNMSRAEIWAASEKYARKV